MKPYYTNSILSILLLSTCLMGCASHRSQKASDINKAPPFLERTIRGKYEQVFNAAQISLANYPIAVSDIEAGILKTGVIKNEQMWHPPFLDQRTRFGHRYTINIQVLKIKGKQEAVQLTIVKQMEHKRNFLEEYQKVKTNGLEEIALFYRIRRELLFQKKFNAPPKSP